ncbi:MAG: cytochrome c, partial [Planctomycetota bacterium]
GLYRKHCVHCHGVNGDGRGPTGRFLNPYPRDYRPGVYKFKSTYGGSKPTDADLHRVLVNGVQGTSMPSFALLPSAQVEALVEYVKYLTMRGELETKLADFVYNELGMEEVEDDQGNEVLDRNGEPVMRRMPFNPAKDQEQREVVMELLAEVVEEWDAAADQVIVPEEAEIPVDGRSAEELAKSIAIGRQLFYNSKKGNCMQCHGPTALGDGNLANLDVWNEKVKTYLSGTDRLAESIADQAARDLSDEDWARLERRRAALAEREEVAATLYPVRAIHPRNLRSGIYRGGRRRIDIFHRIHAGINGSGMPGVGGAAPGAQGTLSEEEIWHIVDYVMSL